MIINPYLVQPSSAYGTLTTAWIAATGESDLTILGALNTLETDLTTYALTAKMKALYPMVGGTAAKHKFNFMDARDLDAAYRLVFNGGWTHSSTGALPNGSNAYADTKLNANTVLSTSSSHLSSYIRTTPNGGSLIANGTYDLFLHLAGGQFYGSLATGSYSNTTQAANAAFYMVNRPNGTNQKLIRNSTILLNAAQASSSFTSSNALLGAFTSGSFFSDAQIAIASIGDGLTDAEAANFYTAVQRFQTTMSRQIGTPIPFALPLDTYTGAAAAYSAARRLATAYTGSLIRVRRSSDNAEQDIGYDVNNVLDESALTTFVGANNGFVTTWYDQSGNANNATQSTAANQPQIVSSGVVNTQAGLSSGRPALSFDGVNDFFDFTSVVTTVNYTAFVAAKRLNPGLSGQWITQKVATTGTRPYAAILYTSSSIAFMSTYNSSTQIQALTSSTAYILLTSRWGSTQNIYINNSALTTSTGTDGNTGTGFDVIGRRTSGEYSNVNNTEIILYASDKLSDLTGISDNINTFYSIY